MKIGIDVSQVAYGNTGVSAFLSGLINSLIELDTGNEYVFFFSSLRKEFPISNFQFLNKSKFSNVKIKRFRIPPTMLDLLWNRLHMMPIENFIGPVDVFITSDWTEPPVRKAKKATILYDLVVYKYPQETHKKIVETQKRKLKWVKKESSKVFCISKSTADDAQKILGIENDRLSVIYPGI